MAFLRPVLFIQAFVLLVMAVMTVPPALVALGRDNTPAVRAFLWTGGVCLLLALPAFVTRRKEPLWLSSRQMYLMTTLSWCVVSVAGAVPLYIGLPGTSFTDALFESVSGVTTTGYASEDYTTWGNFAVTVFFYLTFVGGCSGSTAGAIKIFRFQIGLMMLRNQLRQMRHAQGVFTNFYNGRYVTDDIVRSVIAFSFYFALTVAVLALSLSMYGLDFVTSLSAAATAVGNVGPGLGDIVGPAGNFASLPDAAKWLLSLGMLLGRLEIMTVLILLTPMFWRT
jgi:trk system potassium uptake protein TrkH